MKPVVFLLWIRNKNVCIANCLEIGKLFECLNRIGCGKNTSSHNCHLGTRLCGKGQSMCVYVAVHNQCKVGGGGFYFTDLLENTGLKMLPVSIRFGCHKKDVVNDIRILEKFVRSCLRVQGEAGPQAGLLNGLYEPKGIWDGFKMERNPFEIQGNQVRNIERGICDHQMGVR